MGTYRPGVGVSAMMTHPNRRGCPTIDPPHPALDKWPSSEDDTRTIANVALMLRLEFNEIYVGYHPHDLPQGPDPAAQVLHYCFPRSNVKFWGRNSALVTKEKQRKR